MKQTPVRAEHPFAAARWTSPSHSPFIWQLMHVASIMPTLDASALYGRWLELSVAHPVNPQKFSDTAAKARCNAATGTRRAMNAR
jgi:hypothetical protein